MEIFKAMRFKKRNRALGSTLLLVGVLLIFLLVRDTRGDVPDTLRTAEWPVYGMDAGGTRYSPLDQITPQNVHLLETAWTYRTGEDYTDTEHSGRAAFEATPILLDGVLYLSTQTNRIIALAPETGEELWVFDPEIDINSGLFAEFTSRGVSAWKDEQTGSIRIFVGTIDARLIAIDAETGKVAPEFGNGGQIDLSKGVGEVQRGMYSVTSPPVIIGDVLVVGSAIGDNRRVESERGTVRAYDARNGTLLWSWDPIPRSPESDAWQEWQPEQAARTGGANAWAPLSADPERGLVFVPTGSPSPDYYG